MNEYLENNKIQLAGKVVSEPVVNHEAYHEKFYSFNIEIPRLSAATDVIPVLVSEKLLPSNFDEVEYVSIEGQVRTYNKSVDEKMRLLIFGFARDLSVITEEEFNEIKNPNYVEFNGFICKPTKYRETPLGREVTDILLAVNRAYRKSDYIPCIAWGRNAKFADKIDVGTQVNLSGRLQSRDYVKMIDGKEVEMTAYEVSANQITVVENTEEEVAATEE